MVTQHKLAGAGYLDRFWAKVDTTGDCWRWTGHVMKNGYGQFWHAGKLRLAHRFSYELSSGVDPGAYVVDHVCHNRACVRPDHLRACSQKQNCENASGNRRNTSGIRGVYWHKGAGKWCAQVCHNRELVYVGLFESIEDAEDAVVARRNVLFTHNDEDRTRLAAFPPDAGEPEGDD